jgi:hypothetical protein
VHLALRERVVLEIDAQFFEACAAGERNTQIVHEVFE